MLSSSSSSSLSSAAAGGNGSGAGVAAIWGPLGRLRLVLALVIALLVVQFLMLPSHDRTIIMSSNHATPQSVDSIQQQPQQPPRPRSHYTPAVAAATISRRQQSSASSSESSSDSSNSNDGPLPKVSLPPGSHDDITPRARSKRHDNTLPLTPSTSDALLTLSAGGWVKMDAAPTKDSEQCIVSQGAWEGRFKLSIVETLHVRVTVVLNNPRSVFDLQPDHPLLVGRWYHVVFVHDASYDFTSAHDGNGQLLLYIDGLLATQRVRPDLAGGVAATDRAITCAKCLRPTDDIYFSGSLADIQVWYASLTQGQIVTALLQSSQSYHAVLPDPVHRHSGSIRNLIASSIGGLSHSHDAPSTLTYAAAANNDRVDVILSVDAGSWSYVMATVELLTMRGTNTAPISSIWLMATNSLYMATPHQLSQLHELLKKRKVADAISVYEVLATDGIMSLSNIKQCQEKWLLFMAPYASPTPNFLSELFANRTGHAMLTSRILYANGRLRHSGFDLRRTSTLDGDERLPVDPFRGVPLGYVPSLRAGRVTAMDGYTVLVNRAALLAVGGFKVSMAPDYHWADVSLRLQQAMTKSSKSSSVLAYVPSSIVFIEYQPGTLAYNELPVPFVDSPARLEFIKHAPVDDIPESSLSLSVSWEMYCGGSMGLEAAYMVNGIESSVPQLRVNAPRFGRCPFIDTIGALPVRYVEGIERMRMKVHDQSQVVIYHRDYRELHEYIPSPLTSYTIGRYMTEVWGLHNQWVKHANSLHEVWVPSKWHAKLFKERGVEASKVQVVPEAVDVWLLDPAIILPLQLAERRKWAFLSVFKMEDRKGWRELLLAYHQEFTADDDVSLIIHTYMYDVPGDAWDPARIRGMYTDYLKEVLGDQLAPENERPHYHIVGHYLTGHQIPQLYRACDAYVGPSYGEGWGLPYHEAMSMGLPVIATRWSGQTEFLNDDVAYMVDIDGVVPSPSSDAWFGGFSWAKPSVPSLRRQMRLVFSNQDAARARGFLGRQHVMNKYAVEPVSQLIVSQLRRIERGNWQAAVQATSAVAIANKSISDDSLNWVTHSETIELCRTMPLTVKGTSDHPTPAQILSCAAKRQKQVDSGVAISKSDKPCMRIGMISTIPPTKCGIAMFSSHMLSAFQQVAGHMASFDAIPIVDDLYALPEHRPNVEIENTTIGGIGIGVHIRRQNAMDYVRAAERINNEYDALIIQHEFGIFGGHAGAYILCLARLLNIPLLINFHTVHEHLDRNTHAVLMALDEVATHTLTMTRMGARFMRMFHATPVNKLSVIAHGVPKLPADMNRELAKKKWGLEDQFVMFSSGFIGPNKGYHNTIRALAALLKQYDNITLIIAGEPHIKCGRICRDYLAQLIKDIDALGITSHVRLMTSFIPSSTLHSLMAAADVYIAAYTESEVSSSGTVSLAMTAARVVVATPFIYTKEALGHGRGILLPSFQEVPSSMARAIAQLMQVEPSVRVAMEQAAAEWQTNNEWNAVARQWLPLLGLVTNNNNTRTTL